MGTKLNEYQRNLVTENMGLAYDIAYGMQRKYGTKDILESDDYVSSALVGLCYAARSYNESKGAFSTYATYCITRKLKDYALNSYTVKIPRWDILIKRDDKDDILDIATQHMDSLDRLIMHEDTDNTVYDITGVDDDSITRVQLILHMRRIIKTRECDMIVDKVLNRNTFEEIAEKYNYKTPQSARAAYLRIIGKLRKNWKYRV